MNKNSIQMKDPVTPTSCKSGASPSQLRNIFAYEPRQLIADPVLKAKGWRLKPYRIAAASADAEAAAASLPMEALVHDALAFSDDPEGRGDDFRSFEAEGAGFAIVHSGRDGSYLLIGRWYDGHNLRSDTYEIVDTPDGFSLKRLALLACVWELALYGFERDAWVRSIMVSGKGRDGIDDYLACRWEGFL